MTEVTLKLTKKAANKGGDRYEGNCCGENLVVYFPQALTRKTGEPCTELKMTIA